MLLWVACKECRALQDDVTRSEMKLLHTAVCKNHGVHKPPRFPKNEIALMRAHIYELSYPKMDQKLRFDTPIKLISPFIPRVPFTPRTPRTPRRSSIAFSGPSSDVSSIPSPTSSSSSASMHPSQPKSRQRLPSAPLYSEDTYSPMHPESFYPKRRVGRKQSESFEPNDLLLISKGFLTEIASKFSIHANPKF